MSYAIICSMRMPWQQLYMHVSLMPTNRARHYGRSARAGLNS
jgi:hypothetical protein